MKPSLMVTKKQLDLPFGIIKFEAFIASCFRDPIIISSISVNNRRFIVTISRVDV